jgi:methionyl-tRNA formyltransferase
VANTFRIALIGQAAFGESVLNALVKNGESICGAFCPPDKDGRPVDPVKSAAESHVVPIFQYKRMRSPEAIAAFRELNADLGVMAFVTDIVPQEILGAPRLGTIQYHPSLLPKHRGPSSINWPIIQGESKTGLSIFWPDAGLDTGPILVQKEVTIGPDDTLGSVYFDRLFPMGVDAMVASVALVRAGKAPRIAQDESQATYEGWCKAENCVVDWAQSSQTIHNLIRGADPSPGAGTTFRGAAVQLFGSSRDAERPSVPAGTIVSASTDGIRIAANDGHVQIRKAKAATGKKVAAHEWAEACGARAGDRFGD